MNEAITDVVAQALALAPEERAELADKLLASLHPDPQWDAAWSAEAERRLAEIEGGAVAGIPVEAAIERARNLIR